MNRLFMILQYESNDYRPLDNSMGVLTSTGMRFFNRQTKLGYPDKFKADYIINNREVNYKEVMSNRINRCGEIKITYE